MEIRTNYMVVITPKMNLLQIPIVDKYFVSPTSPGARQRGTEFAEAKGLLSPMARHPRALPSALDAEIDRLPMLDGPPMLVPPENVISA
jgi:hypothetical protein